jgi:hypothetical protein
MRRQKQINQSQIAAWLLEGRPRVAVHVLRLDGPAETGGHPDLDGRQRALHRQHLHRAPLALPEV